MQKASWNALDGLMKTIDKADQPNYVGMPLEWLHAHSLNLTFSFVGDVRQYLSYVRDDLKKQGKTTLAGLCLPKGLDAILPLFLQGIYYP